MILPTYDYKRSDIVDPKKITEGLDSVVDLFTGRIRRRNAVLKSLYREAQKADLLATDFMHISDKKLQEILSASRDLYRKNTIINSDQLIRAMAAIREASTRKLGLTPYVVQLVGALALHKGHLAEMATGEGKTLVAGLASVLNGWTKRPSHVITVNDYLAQRDADWLRPLFSFCNVTVGHVIGPMDSRGRFEGYSRDVTYTTSKEILADFLRDRIAMGMVQNPVRRHMRFVMNPQMVLNCGLVMRGIHTAIVDEADSVLIDEAVTPLIISQVHDNDSLKEATSIAHEISDKLISGIDYKLDLRYKEIELKKAAEEKIKIACASLPGIWQAEDRRTELIKQALTAREYFHEGTQYVIQDDKVVIVDEFTGRLMPQRTWRQGLHQAIEAKEGMEISNPSETLARLSFQRFFRCFKKLSGMTGTASEAASEFWHIYRMPVVKIPLNRPDRRKVIPDCIFPDQESKWQAVVKEVISLHEEGLPVLVGTRNITASEKIADELNKRGIIYSLLNAVNHRKEAQIVAQAGISGRITIATNMAGRGTDIKLEKGVTEKGGLQVLLTERHESKRIDRQFFGRCGRQGDPGCAQAFGSIDDELLKRYLPKPVYKSLVASFTNHLPGFYKQASAAITIAQKNAQKQAFKQRKQVLKIDTWMDDSLSFTGPARIM